MHFEEPRANYVCDLVEEEGIKKLLVIRSILVQIVASRKSGLVAHTSKRKDMYIYKYRALRTLN